MSYLHMVGLALAVVGYTLALRLIWLTAHLRGWERGFESAWKIKDAQRRDNPLGYGWRCPYCQTLKDEGQQTGIYWLGKPVCGTCAQMIAVMRLPDMPTRRM